MLAELKKTKTQKQFYLVFDYAYIIIVSYFLGIEKHFLDCLPLQVFIPLMPFLPGNQGHHGKPTALLEA